MGYNFNDENLNLFFDAIMNLEGEEEYRNFFEDACTITELKAISQRIAVAKMLYEKNVYSDIVAKTGASTATISRVNRSIQYGTGCYNKLFKRMDGNE